MTRLYQFAGSHYCEKARWALDYKGVDYEAINLVPGLHRRTARRIAPGTSLPILVDGDTVVQGSAAIINYLDKRVRKRPLTPTQSQDASMAHEWERYLDRNIGINLRLCFYFHAFKSRRFVSDFLLRGASLPGRLVFHGAYPVIKRAMLESMKIDPDNAARARAQLMLAADRLDERIADRQFLAGPHFSRADLSAAALLFHLWLPEWPAPPGFESVLDALTERPLYRWAGSIYAQYRHA